MSLPRFSETIRQEYRSTAIVQQSLACEDVYPPKPTENWISHRKRASGYKEREESMQKERERESEFREVGDFII